MTSYQMIGLFLITHLVPFFSGPVIPEALAFSASHTSHAKENLSWPVCLEGRSADQISFISLPSTWLPPCALRRATNYGRPPNRKEFFMLNQNQNTNPQEEVSLPPELRAVLTIVEADAELKAKARPHVNVEKREINWNKIFTTDFGSGHRAALLWAKALWVDRRPEKSDPFDRAFSMDTHLRVAVIKAVAIRWGLAS